MVSKLSKKPPADTYKSALDNLTNNIQNQLKSLSHGLKTLSSLPSTSTPSSSEASTAGHHHGSSSQKAGSSQGHTFLSLSSRSNRIILFNHRRLSQLLMRYRSILLIRKSIFVMQFVLDDANPLTMIQLLLDLDPYSSLLTVTGIRDCYYPNVGISKNSLFIRGSSPGSIFLPIILKGLIVTPLTNPPRHRQLLSQNTLNLSLLVLLL